MRESFTSYWHQGSHCDQHGCPRDYQFERMQAAMTGRDRTHGGPSESSDEPEEKPTEQEPPVALNMDELF